jgi:Fur family transcriptional regulator, zinc uptake regulator
VDQIIKLLRQKDCRVTPQRKAILEALLNCGQFFSAQQVFDWVRLIHPDVSLHTIYRNLNLLSAFGILQQIHLPRGEGSVFELARNPHHHLVCLGCGKIQCIDYCSMDLVALNEAVGSGFRICSYSLQFYGYCPDCMAAATIGV